MYGKNLPSFAVPSFVALNTPYNAVHGLHVGRAGNENRPNLKGARRLPATVYESSVFTLIIYLEIEKTASSFD